MAAAKGKIRKLRHHAAITAALVPLTFLFIVLLFYWNLGVYNWVAGAKFAIAVIVLWIVGSIIARANAMGKAEAFGGLFIIGGRKGIGFIERLAKHRKEFWDTFAQVGLVMSFGALSYFMFKGQISRKAFVLGFALIAVMFFVVWPFVALAFNVITIPGLHISIQTIQLQVPALSYPLALEVLSVFGGGFAFFIVVLLAVGAGTIVYGLLSFASTAIISHVVNTTILSNQIPGAVPVIPGINVPLAAGLLAFAIVLVVHEFSHGVLFTTYRKRVRRTGLVIFGVVPVGGFADAGEKAMKQLNKEQQNKVLVSGVMANYVFTFVFFIIAFLMMSYVVPTLYTTNVIINGTPPGTPAYNVLAPGSVIMAWNGHRITDLASLEAAAANDKPNSVVSVQTRGGNYSLVANATGKIGVYVTQQQVPLTSGAYFSFVLNLFVAIFNLLPLPVGLDGWRIYKNAVGSRKAMRAITLAVVAVFLIILLPWIWWFLGI